MALRMLHSGLSILIGTASDAGGYHLTARGDRSILCHALVTLSMNTTHLYLLQKKEVCCCYTVRHRGGGPLPSLVWKVDAPH
jgi:hypothetical protein